MTAGELAHETAIMIMPGYDLGTCMSSRGDCGGLDWTLGVVGVIPGGKWGATLVKGAARWTSRADTLSDGLLLNQHLRHLERYGSAGMRELENGRIRYYGDMVPASTSGTMSGRRLVREWNPSTGNSRTWHETIDRRGRVRIVRPVNEDLHRLFDENGNYIKSF